MCKLTDFIYLIETQNIQDIMVVVAELSLKDVVPVNRDWYFIMLENDVTRLREIHNSSSTGSSNNGADSQLGIDGVLVCDIIQTCILRGNEYAEQEKKMNNAIHDINILLNANTPVDTFRALVNENAMLPQGLKEYAAPLYHFELQLAKQDKQDELTHEELSAAVEVLLCVAAVNSAVESSTSDPLFQALILTDSYFENLDSTQANHYLESLKNTKDAKRSRKNPLLTHSEIQSVIDESNDKASMESTRVGCLERINVCLKHGSHKALMPVLMEPCLDFTKLNGDSSEVYFYALQLERNRRRKSHNTDDLWLDDVRAAINNGTEILMHATRLGLKLTAINLALDKQDAVEIYHYLTNKDLSINNVIRDCKEIYLQRMLEVRRFKISESQCHVGSGWIQCRLPERPISFYYNVKDRFLLWSKPDDNTTTQIFAKDSSLLNREELQAIIDMVNTEFKRELLFLSHEDFIIRLQSVIRGHLVRDALRARWRYFKLHTIKIVKIQSFWRMSQCRKTYIKTIHHYKGHVKKIVKCQSFVRMRITKRRYKEKLKFFQNNVKYIVRIQSCWRASRIRSDYKALMFQQNPSIKIIKRFLHLLENSFNDYQEEIEIQSLKQQISNAIRQNRLLEEQLKEMDLKIGLLVRNRITLQEVLNQNVNLKNFRSNLHSNNGLTEANNDMFLQNTINKATRQKIESYQHLFYLLQTNPNYLANLVFEMPHMQQTKFVETVIFSLYNYGSSNRDEYLLLRLFRRAVESEINTKILHHPNDFLSANPFVIKLIVGLCRTAHAQASLKQILQPLIRSVTEDASLRINTSPIEVYKLWVSQLELATGAPCGLPYDVTPQVASRHPEVRAAIDRSVLQLKQTCQRFMRALLKSPDRLPYSMRYMARNIKETLHHRFPDHQEKDILKVVGNLIYYRYINSAIVAPDAFDMLDRGVSEVLPAEKRRNLASIAKLLQFATANKGFGLESPHLAEVLNPFIRQCHEKFKEYFREVCRIEGPEEHFNMDQYTDLTSLTKPVIRMTLKEIRDTHNLLIQYQDAIAPSRTDPLHELLEDLGEPPPADHIKQDNTNQSTLIWLTLSPKHETHIVSFPELYGASGDRIGGAGIAAGLVGPSGTQDKSDTQKQLVAPTQNDLVIDSLYIHTKRMIVDVLTCMDIRDQQKGTSTSASLAVYLSGGGLSWIEDNRHAALVATRQQLDRSLTPARKKIAHSRSYIMELGLTLEEKRKHIRTNLTRLEAAGVIKTDNDYQDVQNAIARDIRTLKSYRCHRKQEISHLRDINTQLSKKRQFHEDQTDYYEKYCQSCLENMGKRSRHFLYQNSQQSQNHQRSRSQSHSTTAQINSSQTSTHTMSPAGVLGGPTTNLGTGSSGHRKVLKFSASDLRKRGVILDIDGLSASQYKNLQFEISHNTGGGNETNANSSSTTGQFEIKASFMGVQMDKVRLVFSDLLQLQYEGTAVLRMFDRAKVNVNLLVFLLNKKFFAK